MTGKKVNLKIQAEEWQFEKYVFDFKTCNKYITKNIFSKVQF